jgi:SAM-dependent methyltransferase
MDEIQRIENVAEVYNSEVGKLNRDLISHYTLEVIHPFIRPQSSVLLMGLGDGDIAESISQLDVSLTVVEGSRKLIDTFPNLKAKATLVETLFEDFEPQNSFDVVIGTHVLEHVEDPVKILKQTTRWLTSDGMALFTVPNRLSLHRKIGIEMGILPNEASLSEQDILLGHRRVYDVSDLERDLRDAGYNQIEISGYLLKIVPNRMMKDWSRELLDATFRVSQSLPRDICADLIAKCRL